MWRAPSRLPSGRELQRPRRPPTSPTFVTALRPYCHGPATVVIHPQDCRYAGCERHGKVESDQLPGTASTTVAVSLIFCGVSS